MALLAIPAHAGKTTVNHEEETAPTAILPADGDGGSQHLEQRLTPEERQELYQDLQNQTEAAYSDHAQIESRRKVMRERMPERLQQADTDNDNSVSRIEAEENMPGLAKYFDQIDFNHDGVITLEEMQAEDERRRELREQQKKRELEQKARAEQARNKLLKKAKSRSKLQKTRTPET